MKHNLFPVIFNPLNPTAITIISKNGQINREIGSNSFACPKFKGPLEKIENMLFSHEALTVYPILKGIPCLRIENGILASQYNNIDF